MKYERPPNALRCKDEALRFLAAVQEIKLKTKPSSKQSRRNGNATKRDRII